MTSFRIALLTEKEKMAMMFAAGDAPSLPTVRLSVSLGLDKGLVIPIPHSLLLRPLFVEIGLVFSHGAVQDRVFPMSCDPSLGLWSVPKERKERGLRSGQNQPLFCPSRSSAYFFLSRHFSFYLDRWFLAGLAFLYCLKGNSATNHSSQEALNIVFLAGRYLTGAAPGPESNNQLLIRLTTCRKVL